VRKFIRDGEVGRRSHKVFLLFYFDFLALKPIVRNRVGKLEFTQVKKVKEIVT